MSQPGIDQAVDAVIRSFPGFDMGERAWIRNKAVLSLGNSRPGPGAVEAAVSHWAQILLARAEPVFDGQIEPAIDAAIRLAGDLTQEQEIYFRHLIRKWLAGGRPEFATVGEISDFILLSEAVLEDEPDWSGLHDLAEERTAWAGFALVSLGLDALSPQEKTWLHDQVIGDFKRPEFSPFEISRADWNRHIALLVSRVRQRRQEL